MSILKTLLIFEKIPKNRRLKLLIQKKENIISLNNLESKIMGFQNKFYLYKQNLAPWKKNNTNYMNMPEKELSKKKGSTFILSYLY